MQLVNETIFILVASLSIFFGTFVWLSDRRGKINKIFLLISLLIFLWIVFGYFGLNFVHVSLIFLRLNFAAVSLFFLATYFFSLNFPAETRSSKIVNISVASLSIITALLSAFSNLIIGSIKEVAGNISYEMGSFKLLFYITVIFLTIIILKNLISGYIEQNHEKRAQVSYFFVGVGLYVLFNIIFNVILPVLSKNAIRYSAFGDYSAILFVGFAAYAVIKKHLFDIKVIATEVIVVLLSVILFVEIFISNSFSESFIYGTIWALATYGSYLLIKSVKTEIKQREDLAKLANELREANDHLKEMDKLKDDFISMASHELNTPIAAIEGYLSMILDEHLAGDVNPKVKEYLDRVYKSSTRLAALVKDMLNVSRIESGRIHIIYADAQIEDIISQAIAEVLPNAKERKHTMTFEKPSKPMPKTWLDVTRITEIMINILGNAIKYTEPGGKITARVKVDDEYITVSVADNGRGIPKDKFESVFEKFSQVDVLKDQIKGTGLGMYISKKFIELMKGKIWFDSVVGKGTTFHFTLPILKEKPVDPHEGEGEVLH